MELVKKIKFFCHTGGNFMSNHIYSQDSRSMVYPRTSRNVCSFEAGRHCPMEVYFIFSLVEGYMKGSTLIRSTSGVFATLFRMKI